MKIISIEEHFLTKAVSEMWDKYADQDDLTRKLDRGEISSLLEDLGSKRLQLMDETRIDVQVLSLTSPSLHNLGSESVELAQQTNNLIADVVNKTPDRFQDFAALPMPVPQETASELERAVNSLGLKGAMLCGRTHEKNLDHQDYWPLFERAEALGVPLFIHPQLPQKAVLTFRSRIKKKHPLLIRGSLVRAQPQDGC